jgi:hypothetical protein
MPRFRKLVAELANSLANYVPQVYHQKLEMTLERDWIDRMMTLSRMPTPGEKERALKKPRGWKAALELFREIGVPSRIFGQRESLGRILPCAGDVARLRLI